MSLRYIPDPLSDAVSAISAVISAETAARVAKDDQLSGEISALQVEDNVLSQAISVVSQAISVEAGTRSAADVGLSNTISALKVSASLGNVLLSGFLDLVEISAPTSAPANTARLYAVSDQGHTRIEYRDNDGTVIDLGQDNVWIVKNTQGVAITRGQVVYISGGVGASGTAEVKLAKADALATLPGAAIVIEASVPNGGFAHVLNIGKAKNLDTSAFAEGALLYVDATTAGALTATPPVNPAYRQRVAVVINSHATQGVILFFPAALENMAWGDMVGTLANQTDLKDALSALSQGISATSQALSSQAAALSVRIDTQSQGISVVSQALSSQAAALSVRIDTQSQGISLLSQQVSALSQAHSALSQSLSSQAAALSVRIDTQSQGVSILSQQISVLSQQVSAISQTLSALINRVSGNSATGGGGSVTSTELSAAVAVETSNRISADNALSQAISIISQQVSALSQVVSAMSDRVSGISAILSTLRGGTTGQVLKKSTASDFNWTWAADVTGGAGSVDVTSQHFSVISQQVSVLSQALSSQAAALSVRIDTQSQGISVLSQQVSVISVQVASALSIANAASNAASVVSQALSVETANRVSAVNVVSQGLSVLSQQVSILSQQVSAHSQTLSFLSAIGAVAVLQNVDGSAISAGAPVYAFTSANTIKRANASAVGTKPLIGLVIDTAIAVSATGRVQTAGLVTLTTGQWDSITGQVGGLTAGSLYYLDVTTGLLTATAPTTGAVRLVGIALSTTVMQLQIGAHDDTTSALSTLSTAASNALSVANAASNAASVISQALSSQAAALSVRIDTQSQGISVLSQLHSALSQAHSALSQAVSVISVQVASAISIANAASNAASVVSQALSSQAAALSVRIDTQSQGISVLSQQVSVLSQAHSALSQAVSIISVQVASALSIANAASNAASVVSQALSVETANRVSAVNVVSQAVSVISQQVSALSQVVSAMSDRVSGISAILSTLRGGTTGQVLKKSTASDFNWTWAADITGGAGSVDVTSQHFSALSQQASVISQQVSALSQAHSVLSAGVDVISQQVSALSQFVSMLGTMQLQNLDSVTVSAGAPVYAFTSANTFKRANASALGSVNNQVIGLVADGSIAISAVGTIRFGGVLTLTTAQWDSITGGVGGLTIGSIYWLDAAIGKLTVTQPSTTQATRIVGIALSTTDMKLIMAPVNSLSNRLSAISNQLSVDKAALSVRIDTQSQSISVLSQQISVLSQQISVISAGLGGIQMRFLAANNAVLTGSAISNVSGLSISCAAGGAYQIEARLIFNISAISAVGFGLSYPNLTYGSFKWEGNMSAAVASNLSTTGYFRTYVMESAAQANTNAVHLSLPAMGASAGFTYRVDLEGDFVASAAGTLQVVAKQLTNGIVMLKGSFIRAYKIA